MRIVKEKASILNGLVISIKLIRYDGEADGFAVRVTRPNESVKYIYKFPADRAQVFKAVLTQIGKVNANSIGGRR